MGKAILKILPAAGQQACSCDKHTEEARGLLAVALGLMDKDSSLQLSFIEMQGLQRILRDVFSELTKAAEIHEGEGM